MYRCGASAAGCLTKKTAFEKEESTGNAPASGVLVQLQSGAVTESIVLSLLALTKYDSCIQKEPKNPLCSDETR